MQGPLALLSIVIVTISGKSVGPIGVDLSIFNRLKDLDYPRSLYDYFPNDETEEYDAPPVPELTDVHDWPAPEAAAKIGQVGGLAIDTDGNVVVFHRADRRWDSSTFGMFNKFNPALGPIKSDVIMTLHPTTGNIVSQSGAEEFYMPHGLTIDSEGNKWLTDVGLHQVMKIPKDGNEPTLTLGEKLVPGNDDKHFCKPTDVAVASNGDFFVADGYCNGRVMKFAANGTLLTQWGHRADGFSNPGVDGLAIPHSLALIEERDMICVADREDGRIQCFHAGLNNTNVGKFMTSFEPGRGTVYAIEYEPNADVLYAVNGPGIGIIEGFTLDLEGNILETWGPENQEFEQPHDVTVSKNGAVVYVGDIGAHPRVWKMGRTMSP